MTFLRPKHVPASIRSAASRVGLKMPDLYVGPRAEPTTRSLSDVLSDPVRLAEDARALERQITAELSRSEGRAIRTTIVSSWAAQAESLARRLERATETPR